MAIPKLKKVMINGVDVSSYVIEFKRKRPYNDAIAVLDIVFTKGMEAVIPIIDDSLIGTSITAQRGVLLPTEKYVFRGEIRNIDKTGSTYVLKCYDKLYEAVRTNVTYTYDINTDDEAGVVSEIFKSLLTDYTSLTVTSSSVQDTGTVFILKKFFCRDTPIFERLSDLSKNINWQFYYDPDDDLVYFEPKAYKSSSTVLQVGVNIIKTPTWSYNSDKLVNVLKVRGAEQQAETTEFFNGDGTDDQEVTLTKTPTSVKVYVGATDYNGTTTKPSLDSSTLKEGGKEGSTSGTYYYEYDDDSNIKTVNFGSAGDIPSGVPSTNTKNIEVFYTWKMPVPVIGRDQASIDKYGIHEKTIVKSDLKNVSDAELFMTKQLDYFKEVFATTKANVIGLDDLDVGRTYQVIDNNNTINDTFMVSEHTVIYPNTTGDEIVLGDELWKTNDWDVEIWDRFKRLEEQQTETTDLLVDVRKLERDIPIERRYMLMQKKDRSSDGVNTFVLGHPIFGVLGTQELGDAGTALVDYCLLQGRNTYKEFIYDTTFYDAGNSTGTWNTTTRQLEFTANQYVQTEKVTYGVTWSYFTLSIASATGSFTYQVSQDDGVTWQTASLNARTAFTTSSSAGVLVKITEAGATTGTIANTYESGKYDDAAINLTLEE